MNSSRRKGRRNMLQINGARFQLKNMLKVLMGCFLALALSLLLSQSQAAAYTTANPTVMTASSPTLQVDVGFQATYRSGYWTPVHVVLSNNGADFKGVLSLSTFSGPPHSTTIGIASPWSFEEAVTLPKGAQKQVTLDVPFSLG